MESISKISNKNNINAKKVRLWMSISLFVIASQLAYAGNETGNGGNGLKLNGKIYVLDLVEAGAELEPYFDLTVTAYRSVIARLDKALSSIHAAPIMRVAKKLEGGSAHQSGTGSGPSENNRDV